MRNTVPFYLYSNKKVLSDEMKTELKTILFDILRNESNKYFAKIYQI